MKSNAFRRNEHLLGSKPLQLLLWLRFKQIKVEITNSRFHSEGYIKRGQLNILVFRHYFVYYSKIKDLRKKLKTNK